MLVYVSGAFNAKLGKPKVGVSLGAAIKVETSCIGVLKLKGERVQVLVERYFQS